MSRVAKAPIAIPAGVDVAVNEGDVKVKGKLGELTMKRLAGVSVELADGRVNVGVDEAANGSWAMAGTARALLNNLVTGVSKGFERKLLIVGIGYRAQMKGKVLNLTLGHSHPIDYPLPDGITIECPSQTEIIIKGADKQQVGQVAAEIRAFRPPEPYKGKGVKYHDEIIIKKEAKKA